MRIATLSPIYALHAKNFTHSANLMVMLMGVAALLTQLNCLGCCLRHNPHTQRNQRASDTPATAKTESHRPAEPQDTEPNNDKRIPLLESLS